MYIGIGNCTLQVKQYGAALGQAAFKRQDALQSSWSAPPTRTSLNLKLWHAHACRLVSAGAQMYLRYEDGGVCGVHNLLGLSGHFDPFRRGRSLPLRERMSLLNVVAYCIVLGSRVGMRTDLV